MKNSFQGVSNAELLSRTDQLAARERELTLEIIAHLREVQSRRAFVELGFSSLWEYVTRGLKYSDGAAKRRIDALYALREHPELEARVSDGSLSLSTISQVQSFVRQQEVENPIELFHVVAGKSKREVEKVLFDIAPEAASPQRERSVGEVIELKFTVSAKLYEKLKNLQGLLAHKLKNPGSYAELLEVLADLGAKELDPAREPKRASTRATYANRVTSPAKLNETEKSGNSRYVPAAVRREVWRRAEGKCTYTDSAGKLCDSRHALQIEHVVPYAKGGRTELGNLTLLCRQHNLYRAVKAFGMPSFDEAK